MRSLAEETRTAVDEQPFVRMALRAGVLNVAAAARYLDVEGGSSSIATAIRRYGEDLPDLEPDEGTIRVRMEQGVGAELLIVDGSPVAPETTSDSTDRSRTAIIASGDVGPRFLGTVLLRLDIERIPLAGVGLREGVAVVIVPRRYGASALRIVEGAASLAYG